VVHPGRVTGTGYCIYHQHSDAGAQPQRLVQQGHPLRREPAQDALRQDHAPPAAFAGQGRRDHSGRVDAGESRNSGSAEAERL